MCNNVTESVLVLLSCRKSKLKMFGNLIVLSIFLSCMLGLGSPNETEFVTHIYEEAPLMNRQQQLELLRCENEKLRLRIEMYNISSNEINRRPTESSDEINRRLTESSKEINRLTKVFDALNRKLVAANSNNLGYKKDNISAYPYSCVNLAWGYQLIQIDSFSPKPFFVHCDNATHGGGWTIIQRRIDGTVDFARNWTEYKLGFGNMAQEFFIGLDKLHALTTSSVHELLIIMRDRRDIERFAKFEAFAIGAESESYALNVVGKYSGDAGDHLNSLQGGRFYTIDKDSPRKCAAVQTSAWWHKNPWCWCSLNGKYDDDSYRRGINWVDFRGWNYSLPYVQMMIRPKSRWSFQ